MLTDKVAIIYEIDAAIEKTTSYLHLFLLS